jgi:hypothetical protein
LVRRLVPEPGTLGDFLNFTEIHATAALQGNESMEAAVEQRSSAKNDPWI